VSELFLIFLGTCFVNNIVVDYLLGVSPVAAAEKLEMAIDMSVAVTYVSAIVALATYSIDLLIISKYRLESFRLLFLVITVLITCLLSERLSTLLSPGLFHRAGKFHPLFMLNCTLLGVTLINIPLEQGVSGSLLFGLGAGAGFSIILLSFTTLNSRLPASDLPRPFKGLPIQMITLGMISMAFSGFTGLVKV